MKIRLLFSISVSLGLSLGAVRAQQWTFGPKLRLITAQRNDLSSVTTTDGATLDLGSINESTPVQLGGFARYDRGQFFAEGEVFTGRFNVGAYIEDTRGGSSLQFQSRLLGTNLKAGAKPLPWLRLYAGAGYQHHNWNDRRYGNFGETADRFARLLQQGGLSNEQTQVFEEELRRYRLLAATNDAYQRHVLTGQVGAGIDIGGLTIDLAYQRSLTPLLHDIPAANGTLNVRQGYDGYLFSVGYRLLPIKAYLLAPRKRNPAYERIKRDIPFYRNEVHLSVGLLGEDIGSAFIYENRYTRYFTRRFGVMSGLNVMRVFETFDNGFIPKHFSQFQVVAGLRVLPLYSRRHTIGLSAGPTLTYETGLSAYSGGRRTLQDSRYTYNYISWRADSQREQLTLSWQATADYHFALTDRIIAGPWLRILGLDYASAGIQVGYRF